MNYLWFGAALALGMMIVLFCKYTLAAFPAVLWDGGRLTVTFVGGELPYLFICTPGEIALLKPGLARR